MTRTRRPWTAEDQAIAEEMRANGASYHTIGRALKRSDSVVRARLDPAAAQVRAAAIARCWQQNGDQYRARRSMRGRESRINWLLRVDPRQA